MSYSENAFKRIHELKNKRKQLKDEIQQVKDEQRMRIDKIRTEQSKQQVLIPVDTNSCQVKKKDGNQCTKPIVDLEYRCCKCHSRRIPWVEFMKSEKDQKRRFSLYNGYWVDRIHIAIAPQIQQIKTLEKQYDQLYQELFDLLLTI